MSRVNRVSFTVALEAALSGQKVRSYDGYKLLSKNDNIYVQHEDDDRKKRLLNHDEIQLLKDKKFQVVSGNETWESYLTSLFKG